jgi:RNA polymerase sigma-70 factor (ECF subfamily)
VERHAGRPHDLVDHLFRTEAGRLTATLVRLFGTEHFELAQDVVQDTLLTALDHWSTGSVPDNPAGWITQVAKRKAINQLVRLRTHQRHNDEIGRLVTTSNEVDEVFLDSEIADSQLRMMFTCCHPGLPLKSQLALTLRAMCGFGVVQIAKALLSNSLTINKTLYRARQAIRTQQVPFEIPTGTELDARLEAVCMTIYLLFNEGYNASEKPDIIQRDVCAEAIRLTMLLIGHFGDRPNLHALLSLMSLHAARFDARIDQKGAIILFKDQDRRLWDRSLIALGIQSLKNAQVGEVLSVYHLEAAIAVEHCMAASFKETDWQRIYGLYETLYQFKPNPVIKLNLAIVKSQLAGYAVALEDLAALSEEGVLRDYYLLPATQGVFAMKIGSYDLALQFLVRAKSLTQAEQEIRFLEQEILKCNTAVR